MGARFLKSETTMTRSIGRNPTSTRSKTSTRSTKGPAMKAHTPTTKALAKTIDSTRSTLETAVRRLPRVLRGARKTVSALGSDAARYAKARPARVIAGLLLVGVAARKLARR